MTEPEYTSEEFNRLFDAALAEADRAARDNRLQAQAPLVAVDHYVEDLQVKYLALLNSPAQRLYDFVTAQTQHIEQLEDQFYQARLKAREDLFTGVTLILKSAPANDGGAS